jgi:hypothetical protein
MQEGIAMKTSEVLIAARKLIEKPEAWVKGMCFGRKTETFNAPQDAEIIAVPCVKSGEIKPECFCSIGAICYAGNFYEGDNIIADNWAVIELAEAIGTGKTSGYVIQFNDHPIRTHETVLAMFDRAIANAVEKEKSA